MAGIVNDLVSGVIDSVLKEILKKTRLGPTKRRKRQARTATGQFKRTPAKPKAKAPRKQVSRRRSAASRSKSRQS